MPRGAQMADVAALIFNLPVETERGATSTICRKNGLRQTSCTAALARYAMRRSPITRFRLHVPVTALLLAAPAADAPVSVAVRPTVVFAGGDVRTTVRTPRDARNRELRIILDAPDYYASSDVQLDGDSAAATHQFMWKALPGGAYRVEAILLREGGKTETVTTCFAVIVGEDGNLGIASRRQPVPQGQAAAPGSC